MSDHDHVVKRDERGQFLPGHAPRSPGRPRGLTHSEKVRILLEPHRDELVTRALELTKNADPFAAANALRICLERLAPAPKQEPEKVTVTGLAEAVTIKEKAEAIIAAVAEGEISAESAERLLRMVDVLAKVVKISEIEERLRAIEEGRTPRVIEPDPKDGSDLV